MRLFEGDNPGGVTLIHQCVYAWSFPISRKKGVFWKLCSRTQMYAFFFFFSKKGFFLMAMYSLLGKRGIFLWFYRLWNPRNLTIPFLIYSRITQVLVIVEWGDFALKYLKTLPSRSRCLFTWSNLNEVRIGLVNHVFIYITFSIKLRCR